MSTASAPGLAYNAYTGEVDCNSCAHRDKAKHLSSDDKLLAYQ